MGLLKIFFVGLTFLTGVNSFSCVAMNNQKCKVGPQSVNVNGDDQDYGD